MWAADTEEKHTPGTHDNPEIACKMYQSRCRGNGVALPPHDRLTLCRHVGHNWLHSHTGLMWVGEEVYLHDQPMVRIAWS